MADLGSYLARVGGQPWVWGQADCCSFPADWWIERGQPDPMAKWRGAYDDEASCAALLDEAGGLLPLWIEGLGEPHSGPALIGDIGVINIWGHAAGAIWTGKRWACRTARGWAAARLDAEHIAGVWHA